MHSFGVSLLFGVMSIGVISVYETGIILLKFNAPIIFWFLSRILEKSTSFFIFYVFLSEMLEEYSIFCFPKQLLCRQMVCFPYALAEIQTLSYRQLLINHECTSYQSYINLSLFINPPMNKRLRRNAALTLLKLPLTVGYTAFTSPTHSRVHCFYQSHSR